MARDFVAVVEAAYRLDLDDRGWLSGLASSAQPLLDRGFGVIGYDYDFGQEPERIGPVAKAGLTEGAMEAGFRYHLARPKEQRLLFYRSGPCITVHEVYAYEAPPDPTAAEDLARLRLKDSLAVVANDPGDVGTILIAPDVEIVHIDPRSRDLWSYVAAHIAAGRRLRRRLPDGPGISFEHADAILDARGQVVHAVDSAKDKLQRDALREAAVAIDAARGALRRDEPEAALSLWRALVRGTWTLVDQFDQDGRRFVIAVRNAPSAARARAALTPLERSIVGLLSSGHSNKIVAYELGISPSTVTRVTQSACRKLGLRSRLDLVRFALDAPGDDSGDQADPEPSGTTR
ncbi:helix-turn-helix transcriptional regulator [Polyangium aurulentum]|uniref:helix-turn-helix transcriptional regulator n=1 Tax=Polyangium aurulentum TaxID=2567896 RepID=UPI0010AED4F9|nr:LuxR C-terminal-related transcriptional regulator [Polyangium aurulentum]UQA62030.1 LuxR C-terminal-related transcriptional regulator [Polyangium aurulentum]